MKKAIAIGLILAITASVPAFAGEDELIARIEELEERVSALETLLGGSAEQMQPATDEITLSSGTYIIGEDMPAGKYNLSCADGTSEIKFYNDYQSRKSDEYSYFENYNMASQAYIDYITDTLGEEYVQNLSALYATVVNNVRLEEPNCIYIDGSNVTFTPVQ